MVGPGALREPLVLAFSKGFDRVEDLLVGRVTRDDVEYVVEGGMRSILLLGRLGRLVRAPRVEVPAIVVSRASSCNCLCLR